MPSASVHGCLASRSISVMEACMQKYTTIIGVLKMKGDGFTYEDIQSRFGIGSSTVNRTLSTMRKLGLTYEELSKKSPDEVEQLFYPSEKARRKDVPLPDFETIYRKIIDPKNKTTLTLAWSEYKKTSPDGYQYTQFVEHYNRYVDDHYGHRNARMPVERIPGEKTYFDWAGDKPAILLDQETGELKPVSLFVSTVGFSSLCFAEAFADEKLPSFIEGVADAVAFYGAVSRYFVPDNLKTAVTKHTKDELLLNVVFSDLESFYDTVVLPPPSRKPRGKATVEKAVQTCETYVLEKLRNCGCFSSLAQVNARIKEFTETLNETVMRGAKYSARELYEKFDRPNMKPLTMGRFMRVEYRFFTKVPDNYHLAFDDHYYSVPCRMLGKPAILKADFRTVTITDANNILICTHERSYSRFPIYITQDDHMPSEHRYYKELNSPLHDGNYYRTWALNKYGETMQRLIDAILRSQKHEATMYNSCKGILHMCSDVPRTIVEDVARQCLELNCTNYTSFKRLLRLASSTIAQATGDGAGIVHQNIRSKEEYR